MSRWPAAFLCACAIAASSSAAAQDRPAAEEPPREAPRGEDPLRAALEDLAFLAGGLIWYWIDDRNVLDWDIKSIDERFHESAYRFDNNQFPINFIGHALSGSAFYFMPRSNGLSMPLAFLYAEITSFLWEWVIEFMERFSINDSIVTPIGGMAIGEGFYRLGRFLDERSHPILAWIFGTNVAMHEALDGREVGSMRGPPADASSGAISLRYGVSWARSGAAEPFDIHTFSMRSRFVDLPRYGRTGSALEFFYDAEVAALELEAAFADTGSGFDLAADTMLAGLYFHERPVHGPAHTLLVGTSVSHLYRWEHFETWRDRFSFTGLLGVSADFEEHVGPLALRASGRLQPGFGASHSEPYVLWQAAHPDRDPKTILRNHGYYFGWGWLARLSLEVEAQSLAIGAALLWARLDSQEGLDRRQDAVDYDIDAIDELTELELWVRVSGLPFGIFVEASFRSTARASSADGIAIDRQIQRAQINVGTALD